MTTSGASPTACSTWRLRSSTPSSVPAVELERRDTIALVRLNRPARLNAINEEIRRELPETLLSVEQDSAVEAIVLAGAGERAFSAGQDLDEAAAYTAADVERWFTAQHAM